MHTYRVDITNFIQGSFSNPGYGWYIHDPTFYELPEGAQNLTVSVTRASERDTDILVRLYSDTSEDARVDKITEASYFRVQLSDDLGATIRPEDITECYAISTWEWGIVGGNITNDYLPDAIADYMVEPYPYAAWKIKSYLHNGNPYHDFLAIPIFTPAPPVPQQEYITVYDRLSEVDVFETHGLAVLSPTKCEITEEYHGKWTLAMEHPYDTDNKWKNLKEFNIIKALGQLFTIVRVEEKRPGVISVKGEHVFYHLNDRWIYPGAQIVSTSVMGLIYRGKLASVDYSNESQISYDFSYYSDIGTDLDLGIKSNAKWGGTTEGMTYADFLIGKGNVLDMSGGELYRDNFYFSMCARMENASDNAFEIRVGKDLTGIKRIVDTSQMCTYFRAYYGADQTRGTWFAISWHDANVALFAPHSIVRSKTFNPSVPSWMTGDEYDRAYDKLVVDEATRFFDENCLPKVTYEINIADVNNNPDYAEFINLPDYRVGNIGTVYDERLGATIRLKITKTVKDAIRNRLLSMTVTDQFSGEIAVSAFTTADGNYFTTADRKRFTTKIGGTNG